MKIKVTDILATGISAVKALFGDGTWKDVALPIDVSEDGTPVVTDLTNLNFTGAGVTVTDDGSGQASVDIPGGGGGTVPVEKNGSVIVATPSALNFKGSGVSVVDNAGVADITIPGGGGGGGAGGGLFDISMGVPADADLIEIGDVTKFAWSENVGVALNIKNTANVGGPHCAGWLDELPVGDFHYAWLVLPNQARRRYYGMQIGIRDSATGRLQTYLMVSHASGGAGTVGIGYWNDENNRSSAVTEVNEFFGYPVPWNWMHMKREGTDIIYGFSTDGANPMWVYTYSETAWCAAPDQIYFGAFCEASDYFADMSWTYLCYDKDADARVMGGGGGGPAPTGGAYRPMVDGSLPPNLMYQPDGSLIMEPFTP